VNEFLTSNPMLIIAFGLLFAALLLAIVRLILGPGTPDRVVAADTASVIVVSALGGIALLLDSSLYLDIALVLAALAFVGVVAVARAIEPDTSNEEAKR
jgi:multicomponent Na+:H+ antiporter subunit F